MAATLDQANLGTVSYDSVVDPTETLLTTASAAAGSTVLLAVGFWDGAAHQPVSVSGGGLTWALDEQEISSLDSTTLFSAPAPSGLASGTTLTVTFSGTTTGAYMMIGACSFTGLATSAPKDVATGNTQSPAAGTVPSPWVGPTITPTSGELVVGISYGNTASWDSSLTDTPGAGYTQAWLIANGGGNQGLTLIYKLVGTASETPGGSWSEAPGGGDGYFNVSAAYKLAGGHTSAPAGTASFTGAQSKQINRLLIG